MAIGVPAGRALPQCRGPVVADGQGASRRPGAPRGRHHAGVGADDGRHGDGDGGIRLVAHTVRRRSVSAIDVSGSDDAWVRTGVGPESDARVFVPRHLGYAAVFTAAALATGGVLAMPMGAVLMNQMGEYVGAMAARSAHPATSVDLGWHPWAVVRIIGFVMIGVVLSGVLLSRVLGFAYSLRQHRRWLFVGAALLVLDIALKAVLAPAWGAILKDRGGMVKALAIAAVAWPLVLGGALVARAHDAAPAFVTAIYVAASRVCHQTPERSFHTGGVKWPVCGRCSGLYLGGAAEIVVPFEFSDELI